MSKTHRKEAWVQIKLGQRIAEEALKAEQLRQEATDEEVLQQWRAWGHAKVSYPAALLLCFKCLVVLDSLVSA